MLPDPGPGLRHSAIWYGRGAANLQRDSKGQFHCMGNIVGPNLLSSADGGQTWSQREIELDGWGSLAAFTVLPDDSFLALFEPAGDAGRTILRAQSTDSGQTWNVSHVKLDLGPFTHVSGKDANVLVLDDGSLVVALQLWGGEPFVARNDASSFAFMSNDAGRTWQRLGLIAKAVRHTRLARTSAGKMLA